MEEKNKFLEDVGLRNLPFPMKVVSKAEPDGQHTIANISISARIMHGFEAKWIDKFIQIIHQHKDRIGAKTLRSHILDYLDQLKATSVRIDFEYPFFVEKTTPASKEKCLVRYFCTYSAKVTSAEGVAKIIFKIDIPVITTYPGSSADKPGGLFGQLSVITVELASEKDIFPEDIVEMVDKHALAPVYSFLTQQDQEHVINIVHSMEKTSVDMVDAIKKELAFNRDISWYSVKSSNYGILQSYSTIIGIEKGAWIPFSGE
jgi:GTP cyclohydrolase I